MLLPDHFYIQLFYEISVGAESFTFYIVSTADCLFSNNIGLMTGGTLISLSILDVLYT